MHPDVLAADVALEGQKAIITMQKHLSVAEIQEAIGVDTKYKISEDIADHSHHTMKAEEAKSWLSTYKSLLLIAAFIGGVSFITANGSLHNGMNTLWPGSF